MDFDSQTLIQDFFEKQCIPSFGVAGNFTGHLEQAGEDKDFLSVKAEANAPKAIFPTYIPASNKNARVPDFLKIFPFSTKYIAFPSDEQKVQIEPECALICQLKWVDSKITKIKPVFFMASNDCSIRKIGAKKISSKKNWGKCSKGISAQFIKIDSFSPAGILNRYRIASFLVRKNQAFLYGEDSAVRDYNFIYEKLENWLCEKLNGQVDEGPAENVHDYLTSLETADFAMVSIGATRYTEFGKNTFLRTGDESLVILYPENLYSPAEIQAFVQDGTIDSKTDLSVLRQQVI